MTGKVYICALSHARNVPKENNNLFLTTRVKRTSPGIFHFPALAPSKELFSKYQNVWKGNDPKLWWYAYREQYMRELNKAAIVYLQTGLDAGQDITLMCFCGDESHCHRSLLKEIFDNLGYETISL